MNQVQIKLLIIYITIFLSSVPLARAADFGLFGALPSPSSAYLLGSPSPSATEVETSPTPTSQSCLPLFSYCDSTAQCQLSILDCPVNNFSSSGSSGGNSGGGSSGGSSGGGGSGGSSSGGGGTSGRPDINGSGRVDIFDLSILLRNWGRTGQGDLNTSGRVDIFDLSVMLRSWSR